MFRYTKTLILLVLVDYHKQSIPILFTNFRKYFTPDLYNLLNHLFLHFQKMQGPQMELNCLGVG